MMKPFVKRMTGLLSLAIAPFGLAEIDASGYLEAEFRYFPSKALFAEQERSFYSFAIAPELRWSSENDNHQVTFKPFGRVDSSDGNRTHADIRELFYLYSGTGWQIEAGINKVYWGVAESAHLVDIINQTDVVEAFNGEEKLGQPLIGLGLENDAFGNIDLYVLPYFRERTMTAGNEPYLISLKGKDATLPIDYDNTQYESSQRDSHVDFAARWAQSFDDLDVAVSAFNGTDREGIPVVSQLIPVPNPQDPIGSVEKLTLYYQQLTQIGLELQYLYDDLALKFEGVSKYQNTGNYLSYVAGLEYTFSDAAPFGQDVGILLEYLWNNRKNVNIASMSHDALNLPQGTLGSNLPLPGNYLSPFENDIFLGARFNLNNIDSTQFIAGIIYDLETQTHMTTFEGSTRIGDSIRISINAYLFNNVAEDSSFYFSRRDDLIEFKTAWYF